MRHWTSRIHHNRLRSANRLCKNQHQRSHREPSRSRHGPVNISHRRCRHFSRFKDSRNSPTGSSKSHSDFRYAALVDRTSLSRLRRPNSLSKTPDCSKSCQSIPFEFSRRSRRSASPIVRIAKLQFSTVSGKTLRPKTLPNTVQSASIETTFWNGT